MTGAEIDRVAKALAAAFSRDELRRAVRVGMNVDFDSVVADKPFAVQVFELVQWAGRQGRLEELLRCAHAQNPGSLELAALYRDSGGGAQEAPAPAVSAPQGPAVQPAGAHQVFLAYSRKDAEFMRRLRADLLAAGITVWVDDQDLEPGTLLWQRAIQRAIREAQCMIALLSPDANESEWVNSEITLAKRRGLRIFPVLLRGEEDDAVPLALVSVQHVDARGDYEGVVKDRLLPAVRRRLGLGPSGKGERMSAEGVRAAENRSAPEEDRRTLGSDATSGPLGTAPLDNGGTAIPAVLRPYLERGEAPAAALSALERARKQGLFTADPNDWQVKGSDFGALYQAALRVLVDWEHFTPEQRNVAGELLGARREHDTRQGVGLRPVGLPDIDWVEVPETDAQGRREFIYQKDERRAERTFWMARFPITYVQYQAFVDAKDGYRDARWWESLDAPKDVRSGPIAQHFPFWNHPRERVSWYEVVAFCRWLTSQAEEWPELLPSALRGARGCRISLPTEWQWEKAARGYYGHLYPWGDQYRSGYANVDETDTDTTGGRKPTGMHYLRKTNAVGMYPQGASPYGICDLSGNVWEWCLNEYAEPERIQVGGTEERVLRGGSWHRSSDYAAAAVRRRDVPYYRNGSRGFRVVCAVPVS